MSLIANLQRELDWETLSRALIAGVIIGFTEAIYATSLGTLLFSGPLSTYLSQGIGIALFSSALILIVSSITGGVPGTISLTQSNPVILITITISTMSGLIIVQEDLLVTTLAIISVTTTLTGILIFAIGRYRLASLIRYMPYPVMGGFLAGSGWLMVHDSIGTMADFPLTFATLPDLANAHQVILWGPGIVFGLAFFLGLKKIRHFLMMPGMMLGSVGVFYIVLLATGYSVSEAFDRGLLLGSANEQIRWQPLSPSIFLDAHWSAIFGQASSIITIIAITVINLLLNISALEMLLKRDIDENTELQSIGFVNVLSGLFGGLIGFQSFGRTTLNYYMGTMYKFSGIFAGLTVLAALVGGTTLLGYIPKALLGGLLFFLGLLLVDEWLIQGYRKFSRQDYSIVLFIVLIIAFLGFLEGVAVGLLLMVSLFVFNYSQQSIFHFMASGSVVPSNVERNAHYQDALKRLSQRIYIMELEGFIFFGTGARLWEAIYKQVTEQQTPRLQYFILDFRRVRGIDSSAGQIFTKIIQLAETHEFTVVCTNIHSRLHDQMKFLSRLEDEERIQIFMDLDQGVGWCEDRLLEQEGVTQTHIASALHIQLADMGLEKSYTRTIKKYLDVMRCEPEQVLITQGDEATDLYFVEIGQVSIFLDLDTGDRIRLRTMGMGTIVGELSFYLGHKRSAHVITDTHSIVYRLSADKVDEMKSADPELAIAFNEMMIRIIAGRLEVTNKMLAALEH